MYGVILLSGILCEPFVVDEKEYQKYCVGRWKCYTRNDIYSFSDTNWMRWLLFPHLYETSLRHRQYGEMEGIKEEKRREEEEKEEKNGNEIEKTAINLLRLSQSFKNGKNFAFNCNSLCM